MAVTFIPGVIEGEYEAADESTEPNKYATGTQINIFAWLNLTDRPHINLNTMDVGGEIIPPENLATGSKVLLGRATQEDQLEFEKAQMESRATDNDIDIVFLPSNKHGNHYVLNYYQNGQWGEFDPIATQRRLEVHQNEQDAPPILGMRMDGH